MCGCCLGELCCTLLLIDLRLNSNLKYFCSTVESLIYFRRNFLWMKISLSRQVVVVGNGFGGK